MVVWSYATPLWFAVLTLYAPKYQELSYIPSPPEDEYLIYALLFLAYMAVLFLLNQLKKHNIYHEPQPFDWVEWILSRISPGLYRPSRTNPAPLLTPEELAARDARDAAWLAQRDVKD